MSRVLLIIGIVVLVAACSSALPGNDVPRDFAVEIAEGGGFTGIWQGYRIESDGQIFVWDGRSKPDTFTFTGRLSMKDLRTLWNEVSSARLIGYKPFHTPGNLTRRVYLQSNGQSIDVSWSVGPTPFELVRPFDTFFRHCREIAQRVSNR